MTEELKIKRNIGGCHDSRVHACLYFITPNGHGLKSIDLVCMKKLDSKVNIIPIIAKADTVNKAELTNFKVSVVLIGTISDLWSHQHMPSLEIYALLCIIS